MITIIDKNGRIRGEFPGSAHPSMSGTISVIDKTGKLVSESSGGGGGGSTSMEYVSKEIPTGVVDGTNRTFTIEYLPIQYMEEIYVNGILQDEGSSNDYTIVGKNITFTVDATPFPPDKVRVSYFKNGNSLPGNFATSDIYTGISGENLGANKVVYIDNGKVKLFDPMNSAIKGKVLGMTIMAALNNNVVDVQLSGFYQNSGLSLIKDNIYYAGIGGDLVLESVVNTNSYAIKQQVCIAVDTNEIAINIANNKLNDGASAYEVAVSNGFVGTEIQWLNSLQGTNGLSGGSYTHIQAVASTTWTMNHNLGYRPNATAIDSSGREVEGDPSWPNLNTMVLTFSAAISGTANLS